MAADAGKQLAQTGLEIRAMKISTTRPFLWASGYYMPVYNDNRMLLMNHKYRQTIAAAFEDILKENKVPFDVIAGTATSGIPHATTLADRTRKPLTYIRNKPKTHGLQNRIEGLPADRGYEGRNVILIEDLVSTGESSIQALEGIRDADGSCTTCLSIFNYGFPEAARNFQSLSPPCKAFSILNWNTLLETARATGYVKTEQMDSLMEWQEDPFGWGERHNFPPVKRSAK